MATLTERLMTHGLRASPRGEIIARIAAAALEAVEPRALIQARLSLRDDRLVIGEHAVPLPRGRLFVVATGKASLGMTRGALDLLGDRVHGGVAVGKQCDADAVGPVRVIQGTHPVPDERSVQAAREVSRLLEGTTEDDLVLCLISGGTSALLTSPQPGLELPDLQRTTEVLLGAGVDIDAMNLVRTHLEQLKGGGLARAAAPARVLALVLSDVIDGGLQAVGSGPTLHRAEGRDRALAVLQQVGLDRFPERVVAHLSSSAPASTPSANAITVELGTNQTAVQAAIRAARDEGYLVRSLPTLRGEARQMGLELGRRLVQMSADEHPTCAIAGGETTVTLRGDGKGGRNQELALAAVPLMFGLPEATLVTLATDGEDGPTDAAGAVVRGDTLPRALQQGLDPAAALANNDAYPFFEALDDLLRTGPTGTNVCDLAFLFTG